MISKITELSNLIRQQKPRLCPARSGQQPGVQTFVLQLLEYPYRSGFVQFHIKIVARLVVLHRVIAVAWRALGPPLRQEHTKIVWQCHCSSSQRIFRLSIGCCHCCRGWLGEMFGRVPPAATQGSGQDGNPEETTSPMHLAAFAASS